MPEWLVVALLLAAAFALGQCWMIFLKGERSSGYCKLCILGSGVIYLAWTKNWFGLDVLILRLIGEIAGSIGDLKPDSVLETFVTAVVIFLPIFGLAHFLAWLVRRWDRQRYSRKPQFLHGSRFLAMYFPDKSASDRAPLEVALVDLEAGSGDTADVGGDCGGVD